LYPNGKVEGVACEFGELFSKKNTLKGLNYRWILRF